MHQSNETAKTIFAKPSKLKFLISVQAVAQQQMEVLHIFKIMILVLSKPNLKHNKRISLLYSRSSPSQALKTNLKVSRAALISIVPYNYKL